VSFSFEHTKDPAPSGPVQPKFDRLEYEEPRRFYLVGKLASGEPVRIRLTAGRYEQAPRR
jgi:hypothetical protein